MQTKNRIINQSCKWKIIKSVSEIFPDIWVAVFPAALIVKSVHLSDLPRFMIPPQNRYPIQSQSSYLLFWIAVLNRILIHLRIVRSWLPCIPVFLKNLEFFFENSFSDLNHAEHSVGRC